MIWFGSSAGVVMQQDGDPGATQHLKTLRLTGCRSLSGPDGAALGLVVDGGQTIAFAVTLEDCAGIRKHLAMIEMLLKQMEVENLHGGAVPLGHAWMSAPEETFANLQDKLIEGVCKSQRDGKNLAQC